MGTTRGPRGSHVILTWSPRGGHVRCCVRVRDAEALLLHNTTTYVRNYTMGKSGQSLGCMVSRGPYARTSAFCERGVAFCVRGVAFHGPHVRGCMLRARCCIPWSPRGPHMVPTWSPRGSHTFFAWAPGRRELGGDQVGTTWGPSGGQVGTTWGPSGDQVGTRWGPGGNPVGTRWEPGGDQAETKKNL